ncbi:cytochrome P450 [Mucidula mucida]|nr:cytochrome P450 [Mucidula mucida]
MAAAFPILNSQWPIVCLGVGIAVYFYFERRSLTRKLSGVPTVGSSGLIGSCIDSILHFSHNDKHVMDGYRKHKGSLFKIALPNVWNVIVCSPDLLDDFRRAPENEMSIFFGIGEAFESEMVKGLDTLDHKLASFHVQAIHAGVTRNADTKFPDLLDEIQAAFDDICPGDDWNTFPAYETISRVLLRVNNRYFVGLPLCRNQPYLDLARSFMIGSVISGLVCQYLPVIVRPLVNYIYSPMTTTVQKVMKYTGPIIEERMKMEKQAMPNDLITWLVQEAPPQQRNAFHITQRLMFLNMAASTSASSSITYGLFHLATHPALIGPLVEEATRTIGEKGWSKSSLDSMRLLESFERENLRYHGAGVLTMNRLVVKPGGFTFRNGVTVPEGTLVSAAEQATHYDPEYYEDPETFDIYRFLDKVSDKMPRRISTPDPTYLIFGLGRQACPGRFYAAAVIKAIWTYIFLNFEFKLEHSSMEKPPMQLILGAHFVPNMKAKIMFRRKKSPIAA